MSSKGAADVRVVFKDDDNQDTLLYTGDRVVEPCSKCALINAGQNNASSDRDTSFQLYYHHPFTYSQPSETGTHVRFNVVTGTDSMVKNGITINISIRLQALTVMDFYDNKSFEELRLEDYINSNLAIGKEVSDLFKPSSFSSPSSSSSSSFSSSAPFSSSPLPSFAIALESLEMLPRSSSMQSGNFSTSIFSGSFVSSKSLRRVSKKARRTPPVKRSVSNLSSNKMITTGSTTDPPFVLPKTASQATFTPKVNLISRTTPQAPSPSTLFTLTPNISFTSQSNPACVFTAAQTHATERQMPAALSISEAKQLTDALHGSIVKCTQIQNSLYRLLILKLQAHITGPSDTGLECSDASASLPKTSGMEKAEECVSNGAQLANIDSKHTKSTRVCFDNIASECDTLDATGGLDDTSKISDVRGIGKQKNDISHTLSVDKTGMKPSKASSTNDALAENPHGFAQVPVVESAVDDVCSDAANNSRVDSKEVAAIDMSKVADTENAEKCLNGAPLALLCELQDPLNALIRCADIQRELFQRIMTMNDLNSKEASDLSVKESSPCENKDSYTNRKVDMREVQSKLEAITFKTKMECSYSRDPFSSKHLKPSTSEDLLQHIPPHRHVSCQVADSCSLRELPHGRGILKTATGEFIYSGDWCRGKRHGKGEGLIFPVPGSNYSAAEQGFYIGGWKHNMRHGHGKMIFTSDAVYEGQWQFDKMTGYGTLKLPDGTIQEGTWKEGSLQGCALFTWPHGVTEYREYDTIRGQLSSCKLDQEFAEELTQMSCIRSQLLDLRDCAVTLKDEKISLTEQVNNLKMEHAEMVGKLQDFDLEIYRKYEQHWKQDSQKQRDEFEKILKDAESKATGENDTLKKELEEAKAAMLCQICFVRKRDCIILPCSHLLYCRQCVLEHKNNGNSRCPTCRGPINSEILCNVNHSP